MIYAEKEKNQSQFVSVNTLLQPRKKHKGRSATPPYRNGEPKAASRAPTAELKKNDGVPKAEKESNLGKDSNQESKQLKTMTAAAPGSNEGPNTEPGPKPKTLNSLQGAGTPLPADLRPEMEAAIGADFKNVRLHHDTPSAALAENLGAKAFTTREEIYFNQGEYQPETGAGRQLLAHELTHVKQQRARARENIPGLQTKLQEPMERDRYEREADAVANTIVGSSAQPMQSRVSPSPNIQNRGDSIQAAKAEPEADANTNSNFLLEKVSGLVRNIPGYDLLALAIGRDPLTGRTVKGDGLAWGRALMGLIIRRYCPLCKPGESRCARKSGRLASGGNRKTRNHLHHH